MRIKSTGNYSDHLAFVNRNGQNAVIVANTTGASATVAININGQKIKPTLPAHSFNTFSTAGTQRTDSSVFNQMSAFKYSGQSGTYNKPCSEGGTCLSLIHNNEWAYYKHLDFGTGANGFQARVAGTVGGSIEIRIDSLTGSPVGTCTVSPTAGATTWKTVSCDLPTTISGKHILYLKFKGTGTANLFDLNWWKFVPGTSVVKSAALSENSRNAVNVLLSGGKERLMQLDFTRPVLQGKVRVCMFDFSGRLVADLYNGQLASSHLALPLNQSIKTGVYMIKISLNDKVTFTKTAALQ